MYTHTHTHSGLLLSHKKNEILPFAMTWMEPESIMLNEISQRKTNTYDFTHMWNLRNKTNNQREKKNRKRQTKNRLLTTENKLMLTRAVGVGDVLNR